MRHRWTPDDVTTLRAHAGQNKSMAEVAQIMKLPKDSIAHASKKYGVPFNGKPGVKGEDDRESIFGEGATRRAARMARKRLAELRREDQERARRDVVKWTVGFEAVD